LFRTLPSSFFKEKGNERGEVCGMKNEKQEIKIAHQILKVLFRTLPSSFFKERGMKGVRYVE